MAMGGDVTNRLVHKPTPVSRAGHGTFAARRSNSLSAPGQLSPPSRSPLPRMDSARGMGNPVPDGAGQRDQEIAAALMLARRLSRAVRSLLARLASTAEPPLPPMHRAGIRLRSSPRGKGASAGVSVSASRRSPPVIWSPIEGSTYHQRLGDVQPMNSTPPQRHYP